MSKVKLEGVICNDLLHINLLIEVFHVPGGSLCVLIYTQSFVWFCRSQQGSMLGGECSQPLEPKLPNSYDSL